VVGNLDANIAKRVEEEYKKALDWYTSNPTQAGIIVEKNIDFFSADAVGDSIANVQLDAKNGFESKDDLEEFFKVLLEIEPKLIGGKIPDEGFYLQ